MAAIEKPFPQIFKQKTRIAKKYFKRFAAELEGATGKKFKTKAKWKSVMWPSTSAPVGFFQMEVKEPVSSFKSMPVLTMRLTETDRKKIELYIFLETRRYYKEIMKLASEFKLQLESRFNRKVIIRWIKKDVFEKVSQKSRLMERWFKRFAADLEAATGRKFKLKRAGYFGSPYDMHLVEHLGFMNNKKIVGVKLIATTKEKTELIVNLWDKSVLGPVEGLLKKYKPKIEDMLKIKLEVIFLKD